MNTHTRHRLFSIRTIAVAITIAVFAAMLPQTAAAQRASLGGIDAKLDEVLQGLCLLPSAPESCFTNRVVFVTSTTHTGDFGGVVGGDMICNSHAQAAHLPGVYRAWLSDVDGSPSSRFTQADIPYVRTDGVTIAIDWADLTDGFLLAPISLDENAQLLSRTVRVWTGTTSSGDLVPIAGALDHCSNWSTDVPISTSLLGTSTAAIDGLWTTSALAITSCVGSFHLYCFQQ